MTGYLIDNTVICETQVHSSLLALVDRAEHVVLLEHHTAAAAPSTAQHPNQNIEVPAYKEHKLRIHIRV